MKASQIGTLRRVDRVVGDDLESGLGVGPANAPRTKRRRSSDSNAPCTTRRSVASFGSKT